MTNNNQLLQTGAGRAWIQRAGPNTAFEFLTAYGAGAVSEPRSAPNPLYQLDPANRNSWIIVDSTHTPPGLVTTSLNTYYYSILSMLLALKCPFELQYRYGICDRPDNPAAWSKLLHLRGAERGTWTLDPNISRDPANAAGMAEAADLTALEVLEAKKLTVTRLTLAELQNAVSISVSRNANCAGICGPAEEACDTILIGTASASYGTANLIVGSHDVDGVLSFANAAADPFGANLAIVGSAQIGERWIVIGDANTPTLAYSDDGGATWTTVTFAGGGVGDLNAVWIVGFNAVFFVGDGGYIYLSQDGGASFAAISDGDVTTENLNAIKVLAGGTGFAVGDNDTILKTSDGGDTWAASATDTGTGDNIISLWVIDANNVRVGTDGGQEFYTKDGGDTWHERTFPGSGSGAVTGIEFANPSFGTLVHNTVGGVGSMFRTVDGGKTWDKSLVVGNGSIGATPTNSGLNAVAMCSVNGIFAVGNASGGTAFLVQAA